MIYCGIGSRETPDNILKQMQDIGSIFADLGFILRSGGALGADKAFLDGCLLNQGKKEIYLPWNGYNKYDGNAKDFFFGSSDKAMHIAELVHPAWDKCSQGARRLHARNVHIVGGIDLNTNADFIICWTPGGHTAGGTGQAIRLAEKLNIPVFNLYFENTLKEIENYVETGSTVKTRTESRKESLIPKTQ